MGSQNQLLFAKNFIERESIKSVLEIGSKDYGNTVRFRDLFDDASYTGVDLEAGTNVDLVMNLEDGVGDLRSKTFDLIILCSVLEHASRPWDLAKNTQKLLSTDGVLMSCHPWVWRYHQYPDDYFRFSFSGIKTIFNEITFWSPNMYATNQTGKFLDAESNKNIDDLSAFISPEGQKYLPYLETMLLGTKSETKHNELLSRFNHIKRQVKES